MLTGLGLAFVPGLPRVELDPDAVMLLFLLTGLQARTIAETLSDGDWRRLALDGAIITALVIIIRFVRVFPVAFTGIRGVVSRAAALSIPLTLPDGQPFPERDPILFITFCVILATLLGQGSVLPSAIRHNAKGRKSGTAWRPA